MSNDKKITINDDAWAVALSVSIEGVETESIDLGTTAHDETEETRKEVRTTVASKPQHEAAKKLRNRLRAAVTKHTHHVDPLGNLTDSRRVEAFRRDIDAISLAVDTHNAITLDDGSEQPHRVSFTVITLPIGRVFDETTQAKLVAIVKAELLRLKALIDAKDIDSLAKFLNLRKNISALMPAIIARTIDGALANARQVLTTLRDVRDGKLPPETTIDAGEVDAALAWVDAETPTP